MATPVNFSPASLNFGSVRPNTSGPDITVDPSFGPPLISFNGGVEIRSAPVNAQVTASVVGDAAHFSLRDIIVMEWTLEEVNPGELPPGQKGRPPKVRVLEVVAQGDGVTPIAVSAQQYVLVRVQYFTSLISAGTLSATLFIKADNWETIEVPLSLSIAGVATIFTSPPLEIVAGQSASTPILIQAVTGGPITVTYTISKTQLHSGLSVELNSFALNPGDLISRSLIFQADPDAPLGPGTLALDQWDFTRTGLLLPVNIVAAAPSVPGTDNSIQWSQAGGESIAIDKDQGIWYSGHVNAIIPLGSGSLLAGTDSGGVWSVASNGIALPLSNDWDAPNINCLAVGPDGPNHFYAGAWSRTTTNAVYVSEPETAFLGMIHWHLVPLVDSNSNPLNTGVVFCMVVTKGNRKLVLGCSNGVFWADIPPLGQRHTFTQVSFLPSMGYSGLALGPGDTIVVGTSGNNTEQSGFFFGGWSGANLLFQRANINGVFDILKMQRTSLASCDGQPLNMYAVTAAPDGWMLAVLRSQDGGQNWKVLATTVEGRNISLTSRPPNDAAGGQGDYNNCIAVSPTNPSLIAIGWRNGPWFSQDMGNTWNLPKNDNTDRHLHSDLHALVFDPFDSTGQTLYIGDDGGVMVTHDLGGSYSDEYNQRLNTLQFEGTGREFYGVFTPSRQVPGLIAGGLQDNGNVYAAIDSLSDEYRQVDGSDGSVMLFIETGHVLHYNLNEVNKVMSLRWDGSGMVDNTLIPVDTRGPGSTDVSSGLPRSIMEAVSQPLFRNSTGQLMYAMACAFGSSDVYGLFANEDGGSMHWDYIGTVPATAQNGQVWAFGSLHGDNVFAGTQDGRIFSLNPRSKQPFELNVPIRSSDPGEIWRISVLRDGVAFALYNTHREQGVLLQSNFFSWDPLGSTGNVAKGTGLPTDQGQLYGFDIDRAGSTHALFAATDSQVFVSRDEGETWRLASKGLPARPHCTQLRAVSHDNGQRFLYLSTFGRSAWRASLP